MVTYAGLRLIEYAAFVRAKIGTKNIENELVGGDHRFLRDFAAHELDRVQPVVGDDLGAVKQGTNQPPIAVQPQRGTLVQGEKELLERQLTPLPVFTISLQQQRIRPQ